MKAVHHLHAGALEVAGPTDIGFLVEPRLQLDQRGHRLAGFGGLGERAHDRRVVRGAVERLLDGDHVGVARGLLQELDDDVEGFVGMMDHEVLLADRGEDVAAMIAHALGMARHIGREFEVGAIEAGELRQLVHRQHAVDQDHFIVGGRQCVLHEDAQLFGHRGFDLEPDHRAAAAALERGLEQADEVFGLFLDFEFGVPDDAECALALDGVAGEQPPDEQAGGLFERDQPRRRAFLGGGDADEAVDLAGHADQRVHRLAVGDPRQLQRHGEAEIRDEREGVRGVDRQRRQQREDVAEEVILDPGAFGLGDVAPVDQLDADLGQDLRRSLQIACWSEASCDTVLLIMTSCSAGSRPSGLRSAMPSRTCALMPATRTMKNSSRLLAEIDRKRTRSSTGWPVLTDSSSTRRLKCSQESSRLMKRSGLVAIAGTGGSFRLFLCNFSGLCRVHQVLVQFGAGGRGGLAEGRANHVILR